MKRTSLWFSINKGLFLAIHTWSHNGTIIRKTSGKRPSMYFFPSAETSQRQAFAIKLSGFNRYQHQNHSTLKYKTFMYNYAYKKNVLCEEQFEANLTNSKNHSYLRFERKKMEISKISPSSIGPQWPSEHPFAKAWGRKAGINNMRHSFLPSSGKDDVFKKRFPLFIILMFHPSASLGFSSYHDNMMPTAI